MSKFKQRLGKLSPKKRLYALETLPGHLAQSVQGERLHQLLTDFDFIEAKLDAIGVQALIEDYNLASNFEMLLSPKQTEILNLIQAAIRKSAHILDREKTQFIEQLWSRFLDFKIPEIQVIVEQVKQSRNSPCL
jgi:APAF-1 helical domain